MKNEAIKQHNPLNAYLDFACHKANSTEHDIKELCLKTLQYGFNSTFANPSYVKFVKNILGNNAHVGTVASFPLGQDVFSIKSAAIKQALLDGADEIDVVLNIGFIKEHQWDKCADEMNSLVKIVKDFDSNKIIKFIPEMGYLTHDEVKKVAELMVTSGVDFLKTCSGYGPRGSKPEDVTLIRSAIGDAIKIKVAGGISTYQQAMEFIQAGADRIGTSSAVTIIEEYHKKSEKRD